MSTWSKLEAFHAHLDVCEQCRDHPFKLCPEGAKRLSEAAKHANEDLVARIEANGPRID